MTQKEMVMIIGDQIVSALEKHETRIDITLLIGKPRREINEDKFEDLVSKYVEKKTGINLFLYYALFVEHDNYSLGTYKIVCHKERMLDLIFSGYTDLFGEGEYDGYFYLEKVKHIKEYTSQHYDIPMQSIREVPLDKVEHIKTIIQKDLDYEDISLIPVKKKKTSRKTDLFILRVF